MRKLIAGLATVAALAVAPLAGAWPDPDPMPLQTQVNKIERHVFGNDLFGQPAWRNARLTTNVKLLKADQRHVVFPGLRRAQRAANRAGADAASAMAVASLAYDLVVCLTRTQDPHEYRCVENY